MISLIGNLRGDLILNNGCLYLNNRDCKETHSLFLRHRKINSFIIKDVIEHGSNYCEQLYYIISLQFINSELKSDIMRVSWKKSEKILGDFNKIIHPLLKKWVETNYYDVVLSYINNKLSTKDVELDLKYLHHSINHMSDLKYYPGNYTAPIKEQVEYVMSEYNSFYKTEIKLSDNEINNLISLYGCEDSDKADVWYNNRVIQHWYYDIHQYLDSKN
jgi:hypothetical protein